MQPRPAEHAGCIAMEVGEAAHARLAPPLGGGLRQPELQSVASQVIDGHGIIDRATGARCGQGCRRGWRRLCAEARGTVHQLAHSAVASPPTPADCLDDLAVAPRWQQHPHCVLAVDACQEPLATSAPKNNQPTNEHLHAFGEKGTIRPADSSEGQLRSQPIAERPHSHVLQIDAQRPQVLASVRHHEVQKPDDSARNLCPMPERQRQDGEGAEQVLLPILGEVSPAPVVDGLRNQCGDHGVSCRLRLAEDEQQDANHRQHRAELQL
mmetsp:Transcript_57140/g.165748  ORF Transcript_57140/g.165748 Transcript_57140/m.165748 type:complete len:267 (-) Transcript_57140:424-1224(-)